MEKRKLNILIADGSKQEGLIKMLSSSFDVSVLTYQNLKSKNDVHLIVYPDRDEPIDLYQFGKRAPEDHVKEASELENLEMDNYYHFNSFKPKLGIGRGALLLTLMSGGKLLTDVEDHDKKHTIKSNFSKYNVESNHNMIMNPFGLSKSSYAVTMWSTYFMSKSYNDINGEPADISLDFLEPEVVKYSKTNALCVQPNLITSDEAFQRQIISCIHDLVKNGGFDKEEFEYSEPNEPLEFSSGERILSTSSKPTPELKYRSIPNWMNTPITDMRDRTIDIANGIVTGMSIDAATSDTTTTTTSIDEDLYPEDESNYDWDED